MPSLSVVHSMIIGTVNISLNGVEMRTFFGLLPKEEPVLTPTGL